MRGVITIQKPHPAQKVIFENAKRFNIVKCGRRFGKTTMIRKLCKPALKDGEKIGIFMPTYKDLSEVWMDLKNTFKDAISSKDEQLKQIRTISGGIIDCWSMEDPDSGRGRAYNVVILDEFAKAKKNKQAWQETIRPTLADYKGSAWFLSTPKGKNNYFFQLELAMQGQPDWAFFKFTSYDNPYIDPSEIDGAKSQLDDITFKQEFLAEDVDKNDRPFLYAFKEEKHVIDSYEPNPHLNIQVSFDFNKEPMTCGISQKPDFNSYVRFDEMTLNSGSTPELCDLIIAKYHRWFDKIDVTGDATGQNRTPMIMGNINHYTIIKDKFALSDYNLKVSKKNMELDASRILSNSILQNANVAITKDCVQTIKDCVYAAVDEQGKLIKTQFDGLHHFDNFRYDLQASFPDFIKHPNWYK